MIDMFIGFDVEDPIHPESDDAVMRLARDTYHHILNTGRLPELVRLQSWSHRPAIKS